MFYSVLDCNIVCSLRLVVQSCTQTNKQGGEREGASTKFVFYVTSLWIMLPWPPVGAAHDLNHVVRFSGLNSQKRGGSWSFMYVYQSRLSLNYIFSSNCDHLLRSTNPFQRAGRGERSSCWWRASCCLCSPLVLFIGLFRAPQLNSNYTNGLSNTEEWTHWLRSHQCRYTSGSLCWRW